VSRKRSVWQAPARALEHMPALSGNTVNGLGETGRRQASPFFWHEPRFHAFGAMQGYTIGVMYGLEDADVHPNSRSSHRAGQIREQESGGAGDLAGLDGADDRLEVG